MIDTLPLLVILVAAGFVWWRVERVLDRVVAAYHASRAADRDVRSREIAIQERVHRETIDDEPMPPDLFALSQRESEPWAQDDMLKTMRDIYRETRDWNVVRAKMGHAPSQVRIVS